MRKVVVICLFLALCAFAASVSAQIPTQECKPRIKLKNFPEDREDELRGILERTFCEMRGELLSRGIDRFPGERGMDVLKFLDGREKITFVWNEKFVYGTGRAPVFAMAWRGGILFGARRSIEVGPLTFTDTEVPYQRARTDKGVVAYAINPLKNLKHFLLRELTWLTTMAFFEGDGTYLIAADYYYPLDRVVVETEPVMK